MPLINTELSIHIIKSQDKEQKYDVRQKFLFAPLLQLGSKYKVQSARLPPFSLDTGYNSITVYHRDDIYQEVCFTVTPKLYDKLSDIIDTFYCFNSATTLQD